MSKIHCQAYRRDVTTKCYIPEIRERGEVMGFEEVCEMLEGYFAPITIKAMSSRGEIPNYRIGYKEIRYYRNEISLWLDRIAVPVHARRKNKSKE